jgi:cell division topological specificity factor
MTLFGFFKRRATAPVARERLQILLAHERVALGTRDLIAILRDELIATIARHIDFDPEKLSVKMDRAGSFSTLEIDVEIPCDKVDTRSFPSTEASPAQHFWPK